MTPRGLKERVAQVKKPSRKKPKLRRSRKAQPAPRPRAPTSRAAASDSHAASALAAALGFARAPVAAATASWPFDASSDRARPRTVAMPRRDDRETMALLVLPFVLVAGGFAFANWLGRGTRLADLARPSAPRIASPAPPASEGLPPRDIALRGPLPALPSAPPRATLPNVAVVPAPRLALPSGPSPAFGLPAVAIPAQRLDARSLATAPDLAADAATAAVAAASPRTFRTLPDLAFAAPEIKSNGADPTLAATAPPIPGDVGGVTIAAPAIGLPRAAPAVPRTGLAMPTDPSTVERPVPPVAAAPPGQCVVAQVKAAPDAGSPPAGRTATGQGMSQTFGARLAAAALAQTRDFVIYNDKYRRIAYPMGDVPALFGVCTDVVIRAYRALGVDLQARVQAARVGSGDTSIDHRRVETLRRFFTVAGRSLPVTDFAESYRPGDIVSYHRPQNSHSRSHIAVVADVIGPSGRPMIIHNRGWGPQLEDALFVDRITGHYRFDGSGERTPAGRVADAKPAADPAAATVTAAPRASTPQSGRQPVGKAAALAPQSRATPLSRSALAQSGTRAR